MCGLPAAPARAPRCLSRVRLQFKGMHGPAKRGRAQGVPNVPGAFPVRALGPRPRTTVVINNNEASFVIAIELYGHLLFLASFLRDGDGVLLVGGTEETKCARVAV